jgi:hypothetical protein
MTVTEAALLDRYAGAGTTLCNTTRAQCVDSAYCMDCLQHSSNHTHVVRCIAESELYRQVAAVCAPICGDARLILSSQGSAFSLGCYITMIRDQDPSVGVLRLSEACRDDVSISRLLSHCTTEQQGVNADWYEAVVGPELVTSFSEVPPDTANDTNNDVVGGGYIIVAAAAAAVLACMLIAFIVVRRRSKRRPQAPDNEKGDTDSGFDDAIVVNRANDGDDDGEAFDEPPQLGGGASHSFAPEGNSGYGFTQSSNAAFDQPPAVVGRSGGNPRSNPRMGTAAFPDETGFDASSSFARTTVLTGRRADPSAARSYHIGEVLRMQQMQQSGVTSI